MQDGALGGRMVHRRRTAMYTLAVVVALSVQPAVSVVSIPYTLAVVVALSVQPAVSVVSIPYAVWSAPIMTGKCTPVSPGGVTCNVEDSVRAYRFPAGVFEIDEQLLVPPNTSITGAASPNDMADPTRSPPDWSLQTVFLATRGATDYNMTYCFALDMVTTRVGFVLSSHCTVQNVSYQGVDTIRPSDNGALCGGGAFETVGCAQNDCKASGVNNAGSDGMGSHHVTVDNVRINDYYYAEDAALIGAPVPGNTECGAGGTPPGGGCCFCQPNGVRSTQVAVWVPEARGTQGTHHITVTNLVARSTQADAINLHGNVQDVLVQSVWVENSGDDLLVLWGADDRPANVTFRQCTAINPGVLRPRWYGNCVATYGVMHVVFDNITCQAPTLAHPIPAPGTNDTSRIDTSMAVFYTSFGGVYPKGNRVEIRDWAFGDLNGRPYTAAHGVLDKPVPACAAGKEACKMVWTRSDPDKGDALAPYYVSGSKQHVNVYVE